MTSSKSPRGVLEEAVIKVLKEEFNELVDVDIVNKIVDEKISATVKEIGNHIDKYARDVNAELKLWRDQPEKRLK